MTKPTLPGVPMGPSEEEKRDRILDLLEATRGNLIDAAKKVAERIHAKRGRVTSTDVLKVLRSHPKWAAVVASVDPRFMGPVFRKGWVRIGYEPSGSHQRPVSVWRKA